MKGPPENLRDRAAAGFAKRYGVDVDELSVRDGFLGLEVPGRPIEEVLPERLAEIVRGLQFAKSMTWGAGFRFARPVRWLCAKLDGRDGRGGARRRSERRFLLRPPATHPGPVEIPPAESYLEALRAAGVEPDRAVRYERIVAGLDALGSWSDPLGKLDEVVYLVEKADVLDGLVRRAVPAAAGARGRDDDAVASTLLPARRQPLRVRRERRRPGRRARRERVRARRTARGRGVHLRTRRRDRNRRCWRNGRSRSRSSPAAARLRTRPSALPRSCASSAATTRRAGREARQGRPGGRARARVQRARRPHRRHLREACGSRRRRRPGDR